jgi:pyruvate/2-oxoglutarate/acetoin dehydrogenase E1 component
LQCYAAWYAHVPGLKVLVPYSAEDARGLLKAAIRDPDPVVFLENELLYGESFPISAEVLDSSFALPIGKAKVCCTSCVHMFGKETYLHRITLIISQESLLMNTLFSR